MKHIFLIDYAITSSDQPEKLFSSTQIEELTNRYYTYHGVVSDDYNQQTSGNDVKAASEKVKREAVSIDTESQQSFHDDAKARVDTPRPKPLEEAAKEAAKVDITEIPGKDTASHTQNGSDNIEDKKAPLTTKRKPTPNYNKSSRPQVQPIENDLSKVIKDLAEAGATESSQSGHGLKEKPIPGRIERLAKASESSNDTTPKSTSSYTR